MDSSQIKKKESDKVALFFSSKTKKNFCINISIFDSLLFMFAIGIFLKRVGFSCVSFFCVCSDDFIFRGENLKGDGDFGIELLGFFESFTFRLLGFE